MSRRTIIFTVIILAVQLCLIWPVYPLMAGIYPLILGLPLSFAWAIGMLLISFAAVLWFYLTDPDHTTS